jgi:transposase
MAKTTKRRFTDEFKREAVAMWETSGRTQAEVARDLGIMPTMLWRWQRGLGVNPGKPAAQPPTSIMASPADQASEIARLRRELDRTRMKRDILKNRLGRGPPVGGRNGRGMKVVEGSRPLAYWRHDTPLKNDARVDLLARVDLGSSLLGIST